MNSEVGKIRIEDLGYGEFFESARNKSGLGGFPVARVIVEYKEAYRVKNTSGEYLAKITGKQMFNAQFRPGCPFAREALQNSSLEGRPKLSRGQNLPFQVSGFGLVNEIGQDNGNSLF
ncbi:MAG: hypothetical protein WC113_01735 [Candidatus Paceibacterota bacterium]|jgi:hypothetical protein